MVGLDGRWRAYLSRLFLQVLFPCFVTLVSTRHGHNIVYVETCTILIEGSISAGLSSLAIFQRCGCSVGGGSSSASKRTKKTMKESLGLGAKDRKYPSYSRTPRSTSVIVFRQ